MDWQVYKERYNIFVSSLSASDFLACVNLVLFKDFPDNLPRDIIKAINRALIQLLSWAKNKGVLTHSQIDQLDKISGKYEDFETISIYSEIMGPYLMLSTVETEMKNKFQWEKLVMSQQLITVFTFFDAFISDSIRSICEIKPEVLRRDKKISWREVLEQGNFDNLLRHLIEAYVFELGWNNIEKMLNNLDKEIKLNLDISEDGIKFLHYAEQVRNILVHTGGRVTAEFLRRAGIFAKGLKIGDYVDINSDFLKKLILLMFEVGSELFLKVSTKFFGINEKKVLEFYWMKLKNN